MSKARLERLLNLMALLIETPRPLTAEEIKARVAGYPDSANAFRQALERDKKELREIGIPLSVEPAPGAGGGTDGYRIYKTDYYLADPGLDAEELAALHLATRAVRLEGLSGHEGLLKLEGATRSAVPAGGSGPDPTRPDLELAALPAHDDLGDLFGAVAACRPVRFTYGDRNRVVDPYRLDFQRGRWYLNGYDHGRRDERVYRLDRVEGGIEVLDGPTFSRPDNVDAGGPVDPWQLGEGEPIAARVAVAASQAPWVVNHLGEQAVVDRRDDGSVVVELPVTDRDSFRSFVLIFLDQAEVLSPPDLRDEIIAWLTKLAESA